MNGGNCSCCPVRLLRLRWSGALFNQGLLAGLCLLAISAATCYCAGTEGHSDAADQGELSPDRSMAVLIAHGPGQPPGNLRLIAAESNAMLAEFPLPKRASSAALSRVLWGHGNSAVAVSVSDGTNSSVFACVRVDGPFKWLDLTSVEGPQLGILGRPRSNFARAEHTPTRWATATQSTPQMIWVRSRFWDKAGHRYTVEQEVSITPSGQIGWK